MAEAEAYEALDSGVTTLPNGDLENFRKGEKLSKDWVGFKGRKHFRDNRELFRPTTMLARGQIEEATAAPGKKRGEKREKK